MDEAVQERTGGEHDRTGGKAAAVGRHDPHNVVAVDDQVLDRGLDNLEISGLRDRRLHGLAVELAVGLGARALHGRALGLVEHPELNAGGVSHAAHEPVERIDLAHQMALAEAADGRVAGHLTDRVEAVGEKRGPGAEARGRRCSLAAGVPAADDDHVETLADTLDHGR